MPAAEELPWFDACQENHPEHTALLLYLLLEKKVRLRKWETVGVSVPQIAGTRGKGGKGTDSDYTLTPVSKKVSRQELCPHVNNFPPLPHAEYEIWEFNQWAVVLYGPYGTVHAPPPPAAGQAPYP